MQLSNQVCGVNCMRHSDLVVLWSWQQNFEQRRVRLEQVLSNQDLTELARFLNQAFGFLG